MRTSTSIVAALLLTACGGYGGDGGTVAPPPTPPAPVLTTLSVALSSPSIPSGQQATATVSGRDQSGNAIAASPVVWSSSQPTVAAISTTGTLSGSLVGQSTITAAVGGVQGSATVTVTPGSAARLELTRAAVVAMNTAPFATQPIVSVTDAAGNRVTSDNTSAVSARIVGASGSVIGTNTQTVSAGVATFANIGIAGVAGTTYAVQYSTGALTPVSQSMVLTPFGFGNGIRAVGTAVPPGLYRSVNGAAASCYWARLSGFGGTSGEIRANDLGGGPRILEVRPDDRGIESSGCATWFELLAPVTSSPTAPFTVGQFLVGSDVAAGTWQSNGTGSSCYWERQRGLSGESGTIIANYFGSAPTIVTIGASDRAFVSSGCGTWSRATP